MVQKLVSLIRAEEQGITSNHAAVGQFFPPENDLSSYFEAPAYIDLLVDVVRSPAFQRLRDIRFLGAIDYLVAPNGAATNKRHTRFEHSLCVARLAREFSHLCRLSERDERHLVIAALLHDVGHGPLSHSLEPVFKEQFQITHHQATEFIIRGAVHIGCDLPHIFKRHEIDREEIIALISGNHASPHAEALRNPINIDTIEAITRAFTYIAPDKVPPPPTHILHALVQRRQEDVPILDGFWRLKNTVYDQLINSRVGIIADNLCREYMQKNVTRFWSGAYFATETELRSEHPQLFAQLRQLRGLRNHLLSDSGELLAYDKRVFFIDESQSVGGISSLYKRYRQEKVRAQLRVDMSWTKSKTNTSRKHHTTSTALFPTGARANDSTDRDKRDVYNKKIDKNSKKLI